MKKLKIAQVITRMDWGGSTDIVRILCRRLSKKHEVKLIVGPTRYPSAKTRAFLEEFKDNVIVVGSLRRDINPFFDLLALFRLYFIFRRQRFDIIQANTAKAGFLGRLAGALAGAKNLIYMPHGHVFYGYFGPLLSGLIVILEKFAARFTSHIIALTQLEKDDFILRKVKPASAIMVIPSGLELDHFPNLSTTDKLAKRRQLGLEGDNIVVGMISRLAPVKGPEIFIEAASLLARTRDHARFLVVGEGGLHQDLQLQAKQLGLATKMQFLGWREDVLEIISILDVLVQPSLNEAVGRILLEAQNLGVAVVATKVGGIPEVVKDRLSGLIVPPHDPSALAKAMEELIANPQQRKSFGRVGQDWVKDNFSSELMTEKVIDIYSSLVSR